MSYSRWIHLALALLVSATFSSAALAEDEAIQIPTIEHDGPVDFEKEILPILRKNCLACHNSTDAESDLVLENPLLIIKGGAEGPAVGQTGRAGAGHRRQLRQLRTQISVNRRRAVSRST